ncbi:MAG: hypothetical protein PHT69_10865 [Bacteroidales bacterium]|nr:hypothetical protein [Bacteroidales bacterium]
MKLVLKKNTFIFISFVFISNFVFSQAGFQSNRAEIIIGTGASSFLGELGGKNDIGTNDLKDFDMQAIRPLIHLGYSYKVTPNINWKNDLTFGYLTGSDQYTEEEFRNNRNITFRTPLFEFATTVNYFLIPEKEGAKYTLTGYRMRAKRRSGFAFLRKLDFGIYPYLFTGIATYYFNPQGKYPEDGSITSMRGKWVDLEPLKTEGQGIIPTRDEYSLIQIAVPIGFGFKYAYSSNISIGFEYGFRLIFTDYIDDASTTYVDSQMLKDYHKENNDEQSAELAAYFANPKNSTLQNSITYPGQQRGDVRDNDAYMFAKISVYYKLTSKVRFAIPKFR